VSGKTKIEWADATWNPIIGCSRGVLVVALQRAEPRRALPQRGGAFGA
jgi:protein gp37